jgi:carboxymethylenebutenolidase
MSDLVLIEPTAASMRTRGGAVPVREIALGGAPRGLVCLLHDAATPAIDVVEAMNRLALEGFESLAATASCCSTQDLLGRAAERGWEPEQVGMVGVGDGGTAVLAAARECGFGAAVSFSPAPDVDDVRRSPALRTPWLGLFGAEAGLPAAEVRSLARTLDDGSDVFSRVVVYPGVGRDFHRSAESGISYAASYDGWQRAVEWLNARVAARLTPLAAAWRERHPAPSS